MVRNGNLAKTDIVFGIVNSVFKWNGVCFDTYRINLLNFLLKLFMKNDGK